MAVLMVVGKVDLVEEVSMAVGGLGVVEEVAVEELEQVGLVAVTVVEALMVETAAVGLV